MKQIADQARAALARPPETSQPEWNESPEAIRAKARIARVFSYFRAWFPHFQADELMVQAWAQDTARLSDQEFLTGLERTKRAGLQYPPSLPKWLELCRPETGSPRYLGADPVNYTALRIAGQLPPPAKTVFDMDALRQALRGGE